MLENLGFYKKTVMIIVLGFYSSTMQSQDTPIGNKIVGNGDPVNYYIGHFPVSDSDGLDLHWYGGIRCGDRTGNSVMQITNGKVGIGTTNPRANFDMAKDISNGQVGTVFGRLPEGDASGLGTYLGVKGYVTQGADVYNIKSFSIVHDFYGQTNSSINFYRGGSILGGFMTFSTYDNTEKMRIAANGNVGIGTTIPDSKLTVKGKIHAEEVLVTQSVPADYVFEKYYLGQSSLKPDYTLLTLSEVGQYTQANHHLPNVPSAKEIKENGLLLGEMSNVLLQKIEELTLYVIEQNKKIEIQQNENNKQSKEIIKLKEANESFKNISERISKIENELK
jgi:hypothetical protein